MFITIKRIEFLFRNLIDELIAAPLKAGLGEVHVRLDELADKYDAAEREQQETRKSIEGAAGAVLYAALLGLAADLRRRPGVDTAMLDTVEDSLLADLKTFWAAASDDQYPQLLRLRETLAKVHGQTTAK